MPSNPEDKAFTSEDLVANLYYQLGVERDRRVGYEALLRKETLALLSKSFEDIRLMSLRASGFDTLQVEVESLRAEIDYLKGNRP